jgi:hypothetical protein
MMPASINRHHGNGLHLHFMWVPQDWLQIDFIHEPALANIDDDCNYNRSSSVAMTCVTKHAITVAKEAQAYNLLIVMNQPKAHPQFTASAVLAVKKNRNKKLTKTSGNGLKPGTRVLKRVRELCFTTVHYSTTDHAVTFGIVLARGTLQTDNGRGWAGRALYNSIEAETAMGRSSSDALF